MRVSSFGAVIGLVLTLLGTRARAEEPLVFAIPGIPPVFLAVQEYVAQEQGFFKKYGVDVTIRKFETGIAGARAAAAGEVDLTGSPTSGIIDIVSNAGVKLVSIYGLEHSDFLVGSLDPAVKTCKDLPGHPIGVDTPGGARSVALRQMTANCGYPASALQEVGLSAHTAEAMIAGQIKLGVLHLDDVAVIEEQLGRKIDVVVTHTEAKPVSHYNFFSARAEKIAAHRDRYVEVLAALIDAENFMRDPKNSDRVAEIATVTGHSAAEAKNALRQYLGIEFWPHGSDGLDRADVEAEIKTQQAIGGIQPGKTPATYDQLVDESLYRDALALTEKE